MSDLKISSYDFLAIFCPGTFLFLPIIDINIKSNWLYILLFFAFYFAGLIFHNLSEVILKRIGVLKNGLLLKCTYQCVNKEHHVSKQSGDEIRQIYDNQYYGIMSSGILGNIPVLEAQEAFVRNFAIIAVVYLFGPYHDYLVNSFSICDCCAYCICSMIFPVSILLWLYIQKKVFFAVWDTYKHCFCKDNDVTMEK